MLRINNTNKFIAKENYPDRKSCGFQRFVFLQLPHVCLYDSGVLRVIAQDLSRDGSGERMVGWGGAVVVEVGGGVGCCCCCCCCCIIARGH